MITTEKCVCGGKSCGQAWKRKTVRKLFIWNSPCYCSAVRNYTTCPCVKTSWSRYAAEWSDVGGSLDYCTMGLTLCLHSNSLQMESQSSMGRAAFRTFSWTCFLKIAENFIQGSWKDGCEGDWEIFRGDQPWKTSTSSWCWLGGAFCKGIVTDFSTLQPYLEHYPLE